MRIGISIDTRDYTYAREVEVRSPGGQNLASVTDAEEYAMLSETYSTLTIIGEYRGYPFRHMFEHCNPNILWSDDSKVLAVSRRVPKKVRKTVGRRYSMSLEEMIAELNPVRC